MTNCSGLPHHSFRTGEYLVRLSSEKEPRTKNIFPLFQNPFNQLVNEPLKPAVQKLFFIIHRIKKKEKIEYFWGRIVAVSTTVTLTVTKAKVLLLLKNSMTCILNVKKHCSNSTFFI